MPYCGNPKNLHSALFAMLTWFLPNLLSRTQVWLYSSWECFPSLGCVITPILDNTPFSSTVFHIRRADRQDHPGVFHPEASLGNRFNWTGAKNHRMQRIRAQP